MTGRHARFRQAALFALLSGAAAVAAFSTVRAPLSITADPAHPRPGNTVRLFLDNAHPGEKLAVRFRGRLVPLYAANGGAEALIGLPGDIAPGPVRLDIVREGRDRVVTSTMMAVFPRDFPRQDLTVAAATARLPESPRQREARRRIGETLAASAGDRAWNGVFMRPLEGRVSAPYGVRRFVNGSTPRGYHKGLDIAGPIGKPVLAANDGVVALADAFPEEGRMVVVDHGRGVMSAYLHLSRINVSAGRSVRKGEVLGLVGAEGFVTGPHLHWSVYVHGEAVDPDDWLNRIF